MNKNKREQIKAAVLWALKHTDNVILPVNIKHIVKSFKNCRLVPYSDFMRKRNLTYEEMLDYAGTEDAYTDYDAGSNKYLICFNDVNEQMLLTNRYRWNIAHELGHAVLGHHMKNNKTKLFRNTLSAGEYYELECEADYFASYILAPYAVLDLLNVSSEAALKECCQISSEAARYRYHDYTLWQDYGRNKDAYDDKIVNIFYDTIYKKECADCSHVFINKNAKYCPVCGKQNLVHNFLKNPVTYLYHISKEVYDTCPSCGNNHILGEFCHICGTHLIDKEIYTYESFLSDWDNVLFDLKEQEQFALYLYLASTDAYIMNNKILAIVHQDDAFAANIIPKNEEYVSNILNLSNALYCQTHTNELEEIQFFTENEFSSTVQNAKCLLCI